MSLIRSLMGRRKFLATAAATSTAALAFKKLSGTFNPVFQTTVAGASDRPGNAGGKGDFSNRYSHLLSPIKIGNVLLKNRMIHSRSLPHFLQGPETFPAEQVILHYANVARNAAIVTTRGGGGAPMGGEGSTDRKSAKGDSQHMIIYDLEDGGVQNYLSQLADAIHFYNSKASVGLNISTPSGYTISNAAIPSGGILGMWSSPNEIPVNLIQEIIDDAVRQSEYYKSLGYDMVNIYMGYNSHLLAHALSPVINKRTDRYGGSLENRARFPLELFQAIKKACGQDFLIEAQISGEEMNDGGYTVEDMIKYAKLWEGSLDVLQLRASGGPVVQPTGFNSEMDKPPLTLRYAQALKESGVKILAAPCGGFLDLDKNEEYIAGGKTDMIAMARAFICDPEYSKKAYEGRGEDVVPCVLCNDCHGIRMVGPWVSFCNVNPKIGMAHRVDKMIDAPSASRKVAVIGGGPAGMKAAIVSAERGHSVTLYEKNDFLGGQLRHADFASFQWPLKKFKDYLIRQVYKAGIEVHLMTKATPEMIKAKGYDAVLVALGAEPLVSSEIPGSDGNNVQAPIFVYGNEKSLGKNVAVIGGKQIGVETGMYLAENGHKVTVLTSEKTLAPDAGRIHYIQELQEAWEALDNFRSITRIKVNRISSGKVNYVDAKGNEKSIQTDSVVIYAGRKPRQDEALKFYGAANRFFIIGDCNALGIVQNIYDGNVRTSIRSAFAAASQI